MGDKNIEQGFEPESLRVFTKALLDDLHALEYMLDNNLLERDVPRVGAEQEMFFVDRNLRPAPVAVEVLEKANDPRLTTEIARFNLEANLLPQVITGRCFYLLEQELQELVETARDAAKFFGADVMLTGILPTLQRSDLSIENITPASRYQQLNRSLTQLRGGPFSIHIKGLDEINFTHDNMMVEACNTSFQIHYQVNPNDFASLYNIAQAITAPVLAAAVNSPLLFGHRLWHETRLALFQHSADARSPTQQARSHPTRVSFGERWLNNSVLELFQDQIARFRTIMVSKPDENPMAVIARGDAPLLTALRVHNGTIWPWNRACYGLNNGIAHLRIENRALPAGPTTVDEVANTAFFIGLMLALPQEYGDVAKLMPFDEAKANFYAAARHGLNAQFRWIKNQSYTASSLILDHLLPFAREGLKQAEIDSADINHYLGTIEERVSSGQTGAQWMLKCLSTLEDFGPKDVRQRMLTATMLTRQKENQPVHSWPLIHVSDTENWSRSYQVIGQFMSTDLFTVRPDDLVDLAASVMDWRHIRHVPVEDAEGNLVGLVTHRALLRLLSRGAQTDQKRALTVGEIMKTDPITVTSSTPTLEAMELMRQHRVGCLLVVDEGQLVGIVTSYDFLEASARLFKQKLQ